MKDGASETDTDLGDNSGAEVDVDADAGAVAGADANEYDVNDGWCGREPSGTPVSLLHVSSFAKSRNERTISATMLSCEG